MKNATVLGGGAVTLTPARAAGRASTLAWRLLLVLAIGIYAVAGLYQLRLPGLYYDEALDAVPTMQLLAGQQPIETAAVFHVGQQPLPLMLMSYVGSTTTYLLVPAFRILGPGVLSLRLTNWAIGLIALLLAWGFLRDYLDERVAGLSIVLLAANPSFIFWSRMGAMVSLPMLPLAIAMLWSLWRWFTRGRAVYLVLAGLFFGLGVTTKLLFVWYGLGLAAAWLLLSPWIAPGDGTRAWLWPLRRSRPRTWLLAGVAFLAGAAPLVWYNLRGLGSFGFVRGVFAGEGRSGSVADLLLTMARSVSTDFGALLSGTKLAGRIGDLHANQIAAPAFVAALLILLVLAVTRRLRYSQLRLALLLILLASILSQSALTSMGRGPDHIIIVWPIPQVLVATAIFGLVAAVPPGAAWRRPALAAITAIVVLLAGAELWTTAGYHQSLAASGGNLLFSDAIYDLAADLDHPNAPPVVALDWGLARNIQLLSAGRIKPREVFSYGQPTDDMAALIEELMQAGPTLFLFHVPQATMFGGHWELFQDLADRHRLEPVLQRSYRQRDGQEIYRVYRLEPMHKLAALPASATPFPAEIGDGMGLLGYTVPSASAQPGGNLEVTLYWTARLQQQHPAKVFLHLYDSSGKLWAQHDGVPANWGYPTTAWQPGEVVADRARLTLPEDIPPGTYHLFAGMYDEASGARLSMSTRGSAVPGDTLGLTDVVISPN